MQICSNQIVLLSLSWSWLSTTTHHFQKTLKEIDMTEKRLSVRTVSITIVLFVVCFFFLFLCFSFHSLTECDETGQVWHPKGPKNLRQCSLMGEAAVIHSLWILIKFSSSISAVFLFPAEMASNPQGSARCIYKHFSIRRIYGGKEVCLHALMCVCVAMLNDKSGSYVDLIPCG